MEKKIVSVKMESQRELYAREGYGEGSRAVLVEYGFATGSDLGLHSFCSSFACAKLGTLDENGDFVDDCYTEDDYGHGKPLMTRALIGTPREWDGWDPENSDEEEIDWDEFEAWHTAYCERVL